MSRKEEEDEDFDELMREIEREAREAADAHFKDLYEASTGTGTQTKNPGSDVSETVVEQRKGGLRAKLEAYPDRDFPVSEFSKYSDKRWVLLEAGEFTEVSIIIDSVPDYLQDLKSAICYHLLPATHPFGTIRSFRSSEVYGIGFSYVQRYLFEPNRLVGSAEHILAIDSNMLNQALDDARDMGSARGYNTLFFHICFWMSLSIQKLLPDEYCLDVNPAEVDTKSRRQDVLNTIAEKFTGWKPFSEQELTDLLRYAFFWIDKGLPVIQDIQEYVTSNPAMLKKQYVAPEDGDSYFEEKVGQQVDGVLIVGFTHSPQVNRVRSRTGKLYINHYRNYFWRQKFAYAIDRVRNAVFILFCLMTGMRKREMAPLTFDDVRKGADGVWRVDFSRFKTSDDPNYFGDPDTITLPNYLGEAIWALKKLREFDGNYLKGYIFQPVIGTHETNRTDRMIMRLASLLGNEVGVDSLHIHRFRKTIAEMLIHDSERNIDIIRMIFGHASYVMTLRYIARNPFLVASVVETLKEHLAADFVDIVRAIKTGVYAGEGATHLAERLNQRPEMFTGKLLITTVMQYVSHMFEGGSAFLVQRTSLGTVCLAKTYQSGADLPPCLKSSQNLIYPVVPDVSNCQIHCSQNLILERSKDAIEHNIKFYRTILKSRSTLKSAAVHELEMKISINEDLLLRLESSAGSKQLVLARNERPKN